MRSGTDEGIEKVL